MGLRARQACKVERGGLVGGRDHRGQPCVDRSQRLRSAGLEDRGVRGEIHCIGAGVREILRGKVEVRQHRANAARLCGRRAGGRDPRQELDQRRRLALDHPPRCAAAVMHGARHGAALARQMIQQTKEIGQIGIVDPPLVKRQDEARPRACRAGRLDQPVGIGDALGDALGRDQLAHVIFADQPGEILRAQMGVNRHCLSRAPIRSAGGAA